jgi:hypothetical protein
MRKALQTLGLIALLLGASLTGYAVLFRPPATPHGITARSGRAQARADLAAGRLRLLQAGTRGVFAPGVPEKDTRFTRLPRLTLPSGCMNPDASRWMDYAAAYNKVIVARLLDSSR